MRIPGAVGPSYLLSTVPFEAQRTINFYLEPSELQTGKDGSIAAMPSRPGLTKELTLPLSPVRGMWRVSSTGAVYAVGGNSLYSISSSMVATKVGTLDTDSGSVSMSDNGVQLIVVDGIFGYIVTLATGAFARISDPAFYSSKKVVFIDGYFELIRPDTGQFYRSNQYDGFTYDPLQFLTAEASPDVNVGLMTYRNQLVVFGERTTEFFYDSGDVSTFTKIQGALIEHGCAAALSPAKDGDTLLWLGQDEYGQGVVYRAVGYQAARASNYGVELAIQGYGDISDATAFMFQVRGHSFYALNFTNAATTWVYDVSLGQWVEWSSIASDGSWGRWRANTHVFAFGKHLVGDFENGKIYSLDFSNFTDDGAILPRRRRFPHVSANLKRVIHSKFQIDARLGTGTDGTNQGQQPTMMLRYSDDGGISWSSEKWRPIGRIGQNLSRCIWRSLGMSRNRVYEITVTDPVDVALIGADLDAITAAS